MQVQAEAWIATARKRFDRNRKRIHRFLALALVAPIFVTVTAPLPAQAATVTAGDSYCTQTVSQTSGVTVTHSGTSCIVSFAAPSNTTTTTTWTVPSGASSVAVLIVAGGGSGGVRHGAGGGAGGYIYSTGVSLTVGGTVSITVGKGGDAVSGNASNGNAGANSSFNGTTATGGGFGGQTTNGGSGGSGGGGCCSNAAGTGTSGQGNNGGTGTQGSSENNWSGGGGGGSGSGGGNSTSTSSIGASNSTSGTVTGGAGGNGTLNSITGTSVCYAAGGGGGVAASGANGGAGGVCGSTTSGGNGGKGPNSTSPNYAAGQGVDGTGSGGGGGGFEGGTNASSGRGGSGIVVVAYDMPTITFSANNGTGTPSVASQMVNTSGQVTLATKNTLARTGYVFGGWNAAADGTGTNYAESAVISPTASATLYARWYPIATFNGNGYLTDASTVPAPQSITATTATNSLPIPYSLRKGLYRFGGWNTNETGTGTNTAGSNVDIYDIKEPYLRLEAQNYNTTTNVWTATNGTSVPASKVKSAANITKILNTSTSANGGTETFTAIRGTIAAGIALGNASLSNGFTFCTVARATTTQTVGAASGGRIFDGVSGNFLVGWWAGYQASFYHEGWMNNSTTARNTNFHVVCDRPASNRFDGTQVSTTGSGTTTLPEMSINNGNYTDGSTIRAGGGTPANTTETTPWEVAEVIIYDSTLSDTDLLKVESYLKYRYGVTAATNGSYTAGSASATYQTAAPQTLYAQWNSVITYNANGGTGSVPANTTISGTSGTLASNTGSLANGANAFLGWYTNSSGTGGTYYAAGASYPNTGSKTLYAVYGPALSIGGGTTATFANGTGGRTESYTVTGGVGTRIFSNVISPANSGITLDTSTATAIAINVSPTVATGTYYDTITVRDDGFSTTKTITITVVDPLTWSASNPTAVVTTYGKPTRTRFNLSGGSGTRVATLTQMSSPAPRFVTIDTSTIGIGYITLITDTVTVAGTYLESITVTDATNVKKTALVTITINAPPDISYTTATDVEYPLLSTDLYIHYDFSNTSSYSGSGTTLTDLKGGAIASAVGSNAAGVISSASIYGTSGGGNVSLNGTNVVKVQHSPLGNTQSFSKFLWIYPTSSTGSLIDDCDTAACDSYHQSEFEMSAGVLSARAYGAGSVNSGSTTVSLNQWHYVGFSWEYVSASSSNFKLYLDGKLVGTSSGNTARSAPSGSEYNYISKGDGTAMVTTASGTFLLGAFHFYKAALTPNQVLANYANTKTKYLSLSPAAPSVSGFTTFTMTEGNAATYQIFSEVGGTGANTFSLSGTNSAISLVSVGTDQTSIVVSSAITATNATTAKTYYETLTATDSASAATAYYLTINVNPKIAITTTTDTVTTTFGKVAYDTITAAYGTGALTISRASGSGSSAITAPVTGNQALLTIAATLPAGTYYETFTATDSLGATTTKVIFIIVNPALTLTSATGSSTLETTYSKAASLTINVANGTGTRLASALPVTISGVSLTTTNLQTGSIVLALTSAVAVGTYTETITVTDSVSASTSLVITIIVNAAPTISYGGATSGTISFVTTKGGSLQSNSFTAANGTGIRSLTLSGVNAGISIDTSTTNNAVLTFGPALASTDTTTPKTYYETLTVTDSLSVTATRSITIVVNPAIVETATFTTLATTSGIETTTTIYATQGSSNKSFTLTGTAPAGVTLTTSTNQATLRVLSTINPGTYYETVTASDTASASTSIVITIVVSPPPTLLGGSRIETSKGVTYKSSLYAIGGGTGTLTMTVTNSPMNNKIILTGSTSAGSYLYVDSTSETGTYTSTIRVTDARGAYSEIAVTVVVNAPVTLTGSLNINKTYGNATTNGYSTNGSGTAPFIFSGNPICAVVRTVSGNITFEKITGTDSCTWTAPVGVSSVDALLVGAGGGGGGDGGSGGGGGSTNILTAAPLPANRQLTVQVGAGGTGGVWSGASATSGGTTSLVSGSTTYTAPGGSGGGGCGSAASAGGVVGSGGTVTKGGNGGYGATGTSCSAGNGAAGSMGPFNTFMGTSITYGGGGGGGSYPGGAVSVGGNLGGDGGGGTSAIAKGSGAYGLPTYFRKLASTPNAASNRDAFTESDANFCGAVTANVNYTTDSDFPCSQLDNFQGYATGYFVAPASGTISFCLYSDDSSYLEITIAGTTKYMSKTGASTTWQCDTTSFTGFVQGTAYPISAYFTEMTGGASWKIAYTYGSVGSTSSPVLIPLSQFRSNSEGLAQYFQTSGSTPALATTKPVFTASSTNCAERVGNINYSADADFPCSQKDNFQGYATGYFVAPYTGDITFYLDSDDSSDLQITVNGVTQELQLSIGSTSATYSGFIQGQYYPISTYFTEIGGVARWTLSFSYGSQTKTAIPNTYLRSTADFTAATAGTNGLGGGGGAGTAGLFKIPGASGGSGAAIIRYLTQSDTATETMITAIVNADSPSGLLTLNIPAYVNVGTYTETITVRDAVNSAPYSATVSITINKATPTLRLGLPGGVTTAQYGKPVTLSATVSTPGRVAFKKSGAVIAGCESVTATSGIASCSWTPTVVETASVSALLSPTDSLNYNNSVETASASNLSILVLKSDTLTVTANNLTATYSESNTVVNTSVPTSSFSLTGLATLAGDSITAVTYTYSGTINGGSSYSASATVPKQAGAYTITPSSAVFSPGSASNYSSIVYTAGTLTINRSARGTWSINYGTANYIRYGAGKNETPTVTFSGDGSPSFTTSSSVCSVTITGVITTLGVGSCTLQVVLPQTNNWLSDTKTVTVIIDRGLRTASITPALTIIKYGDTTTAVATISPALDSATVTYTSNGTLGCMVDNITGLVTGIKALTACSIKVTYDQTTLYESATASASITVNKATAPIVTTDTITALSYTGNTALVTPTYKVTGIVARDISQILPSADVSTAAAIASINSSNYSSVASFRYRETAPTTSYDSTTAPTLGGTYSVTPQNFTLSSGVDINNYETPTYISRNLVINPIAQTPLVIKLSYLESITVPFDVQVIGGSSTGVRTLNILSGGTATGCAVDSGVSLMRLKTSTSGTCVISVTQAADRNYLSVTSDSQTVRILNFVVNVLQLFDNPTGISINHSVPVTKGADACTSNCQPRITRIVDMSGNTITTIKASTSFRIIGTNFNTATTVSFSALIGDTQVDEDVLPPNFLIDSDTQITVVPPSTITPISGQSMTSAVVVIYLTASGGVSPANMSIVAISL